MIGHIIIGILIFIDCYLAGKTLHRYITDTIHDYDGYKDLAIFIMLISAIFCLLISGYSH